MPIKPCLLVFHTEEPCARHNEPVSVGLPWPKGLISDERCFQLLTPAGADPTLQTKVLDRWPDGSIRWCLFDFLAAWDGISNESGYSIAVGEPRTKSPETSKGQPNDLLLDIELSSRSETQVVRADTAIEHGPIRTRWALAELRAAPCRIFGHVDTFANSQCQRYQLTIHNPQPAEHLGGNWDLGTNGSVFISQLRVRPKVTSDTEVRMFFSSERGNPLEEVPSARLTQASSGLTNWNSTNHINRERRVDLPYRGYQCKTGNILREGNQATPIAIMETVDKFLGMTMTRFWENFPKTIRLNDSPREILEIELNLFPTTLDIQELQGGEQKTHTFSVSFGRDTITEEPMIWCRSPIACHASPEWYAESGAIPYYTPKASDPHREYLALVDQAIEGSDTFLHKRERIDQYGWRNFGCVYGDHEAVNHKGDSPLISHYNNQYDCVAGFLLQFLRSGDLRWFSLGLECVDHTSDIDIYHTDGDKAAYNRGLFWHTYHYADADTGTHRAYPKSITRGPQESLTTKMDDLGETAKHLQKSYAVGGGPSASHNYNAGLMLAYFLTGNPLYRDSALDLANFVIAMEDPTKTPFRYLSREYTGLATESGGGGYHGPGRAAGNSILALIVGHRLTGEQRFLDKAEQIIRRVVHPAQNLEALDLLNAELRWFYTMTLQAIGQYLDYKVELNQLDEHYAYARLTLLHYARWMAKHERPILDTPERLQYPTESWAAQDMRKVEVFQFAAKHATGDERTQYLEKAQWFFEYVPRKLNEFETKSLCRPVVLMLNFGWSRNWWRMNPDTSAPEPLVKKSASDFGEWRMFVPQKLIAIRRAKRIVAFGALGGVLIVLALIWRYVI